jgi:hypothetical protein
MQACALSAAIKSRMEPRTSSSSLDRWLGWGRDVPFDDLASAELERDCARVELLASLGQLANIVHLDNVARRGSRTLAGHDVSHLQTIAEDLCVAGTGSGEWGSLPRRWIKTHTRLRHEPQSRSCGGASSTGPCQRGPSPCPNKAHQRDPS